MKVKVYKQDQEEEKSGKELCRRRRRMCVCAHWFVQKESTVDLHIPYVSAIHKQCKAELLQQTTERGKRKGKRIQFSWSSVKSTSAQFSTAICHTYRGKILLMVKMYKRKRVKCEWKMNTLCVVKCNDLLRVARYSSKEEEEEEETRVDSKDQRGKKAQRQKD